MSDIKKLTASVEKAQQSAPDSLYRFKFFTSKNSEKLDESRNIKDKLDKQDHTKNVLRYVKKGARSASPESKSLIYQYGSTIINKCKNSFALPSFTKKTENKNDDAIKCNECNALIQKDKNKCIYCSKLLMRTQPNNRNSYREFSISHCDFKKNDNNIQNKMNNSKCDKNLVCLDEDDNSNEDISFVGIENKVESINSKISNKLYDSFEIENKKKIKLDKNCNIRLTCHKVYIGASKSSVTEHVDFNNDGFVFYFKKNKFALTYEAVEQFIVPIEPKTETFVSIIVDAKYNHVQSLIKNMEETNSEQVYNPKSEDPCLKFIIFKVYENVYSLNEKKLHKILNKQTRVTKLSGSKVLINEIEDKIHQLQSKQVSGNNFFLKDSKKTKVESVVEIIESDGESDNNSTAIEDGSKHEILCYPKKGEENAVTINSSDLECLEEHTFLNDKILNFYFMYIKNELISKDVAEKTFIFNTFFFSKLVNENTSDNPKLSPSENIYNRVKNWTKNVDLFEYDFLILPIFIKNHWLLAIICYPGMLLQDSYFILDDNEINKRPCMIFMDSLRSGNANPNIFKPNYIRHFFSMECKTKKEFQKIFLEKFFLHFILQCQVN